MQKRRIQYSQKEKERRNRQTYLEIRRKIEKVGSEIHSSNSKLREIRRREIGEKGLKSKKSNAKGK